MKELLLFLVLLLCSVALGWCNETTVSFGNSTSNFVSIFLESDVPVKGIQLKIQNESCASLVGCYSQVPGFTCESSADTLLFFSLSPCALVGRGDRRILAILDFDVFLEFGECCELQINREKSTIADENNYEIPTLFEDGRICETPLCGDLPTGEFCIKDGVIDIFDLLVLIDSILNKPNCCD